jgi:hypothetical protein
MQQLKHLRTLHELKGRGNWGTEDAAGEGIQHVPAVRNEEQLRSILGVCRRSCGARRWLRVRVGVVFRGAGARTSRRPGSCMGGRTRGSGAAEGSGSG